MLLHDGTLVNLRPELALTDTLLTVLRDLPLRQLLTATLGTILTPQTGVYPWL